MWAGPPVLDGINDVEDFITGYIRTDKASISFNGAWAQNIDKNEMFIDFMGDRGGIRMMYGGDYTFYTVENKELVQYKPEYEIPNMYELEDKDFIRSIRTGEPTRNHIDKAVSYTHLDVYKRQADTLLKRQGDCQAVPFTQLLSCLLYTSRCV